MGGPFSTNLRRMHRRRSTGGAGADHADEMHEADQDRRMREAIAKRDAERGRPLTAKEQLDNLTAAIGECDTDCASHAGAPCTCGAVEFKAKFGPGKYTP